MSSNRKRAKEAKAPEQMPPQAPDLDTVYRPELTGADIDLLGNLIDAWVKHGGVQVVAMAMPLLEKVTAQRRAALQPKAP